MRGLMYVACLVAIMLVPPEAKAQCSGTTVIQAGSVVVSSGLFSRLRARRAARSASGCSGSQALAAQSGCSGSVSAASCAGSTAAAVVMQQQSVPMVRVQECVGGQCTIRWVPADSAVPLTRSTPKCNCVNCECPDCDCQSAPEITGRKVILAKSEPPDISGGSGPPDGYLVSK